MLGVRPSNFVRSRSFQICRPLEGQKNMPSASSGSCCSSSTVVCPGPSVSQQELPGTERGLLRR
eukprot:5947286-Pyramimonas_sp.AAC.1